MKWNAKIVSENGGMVLLFCSQEALSQLRGVSSSGLGRTSEPIETLQSRARELEKKVCVCFSDHLENLVKFTVLM